MGAEAARPAMARPTTREAGVLAKADGKQNMKYRPFGQHNTVQFVPFRSRLPVESINRAEGLTHRDKDDRLSSEYLTQGSEEERPDTESRNE